MQLQKAARKQSKIKLSISGSSRSGKTFSALLLAYGICGDWNKIAVLDSENYSASLYAHLGSFNVINLQEPFTPEQ
jgi:adenylylsulfate kinase-like enzyme